MNTFVERLRAYAPYMPRPIQADTVDEAAYVIETLQEALQKIVRNQTAVFDEDEQGVVLVSLDAEEMLDIAENALAAVSRILDARVKA